MTAGGVPVYRDSAGVLRESSQGSPKHIGRYLSEMTWRFNARSLEEGERVNALIAQTTGRLTYKELIA